MKLAILLSSTFLSASSIGAMVPQITQKHQVVVNNNYNYVEKIAKIMSEEINSKNESEIKNIFINAIKQKDGSLTLDVNQIKQIQNLKIQNVFLDQNFSKVLNKMFESKMLILENGKYNFNVSVQKVGTQGLWIENPWYWFGYTKWHLDDSLTNYLTMMFWSVTNIDEGGKVFLETIPEFGVLGTLTGKSLYQQGGSKYLSQVNSQHKGVWYGSWSTFWDGPWSQ
ncbi:hypothetical protein ELUMI_v1c01240 [Williamsoniiplasma luminosum]|uniref:Uncharacterized protein n=1 Tax=Williamsoniiplasma luminosum TaxID=214888 RepID=A0A2K8NSM8_9MOLU|nr:hypothetical protein [Williamsoniiplasma luminosum]ATZ16852.1 hypothetical protein ELUMI_v1c01240 [Williamsoniiplasma luminosum]